MATLTDDQVEGAEFLAARPVAMLADQIGFGKSAQYVVAADLVDARTITVLCPPILRRNQAVEFEKWSFMGQSPTIIYSGKDAVPPTGLVICSYKLAAENKEIKKALRKRGSHVLILEEAHALKNPKSVRSKAIFQADGISRTANQIWFVTATPDPNTASEWYTFAASCGAWGRQAAAIGVPATYNEFVKRYCDVGEPPDTSDAIAYFRYALGCGSFRGSFKEFAARYYFPHGVTGALVPRSAGAMRSLVRLKISGTRNEEELKAILRPYVLARDKIDPDRGPLTVDDIQVDGDRPTFEGVPLDALEAIEAAIAAGDWHLLDGPAVATVRRHIGVAKAGAVADLIEAAHDAGHRKVLTFCEHTAVIDTIAARLGAGAAIIDGRTSQKKREALLQDFQFGTLTDLICQRMALKEGVTLTAATRVIGAEPPWTPTDWAQMYGRAWRKGQTAPVYASSVYLADSFDSRVAATISRKTLDRAKISMLTVR